MNNRLTHALLFLVGAATGAPVLAQGTQTSTQRSFQGWLTDLTEPAIWTWRPSPSVSSPVYSTHMRPWVHVDVNDATGQRFFDTTTFALDHTRIDALAHTVVAKWQALGRPSDYAIFIHGWGWKTGLYRHPSDFLQAPAGGAWNRSDLPEDGTPWRDYGVDLSAAVLDALISAISTQADPGSPPDPSFVLPPPKRLLFDEEHGIGSFCNSPNVRQVLSAIGSDTARHGDAIFGDHSLRTAAAWPTIADAYGSTMWGWVTGLAWSDSTSYPCYPWYGLNFMNEFYSAHSTISDGAIRAVFDLGTASHPSWQSAIVSNYSTSGWYDFDYPQIGQGGFGARGPVNYSSGAPLGWQLSSRLGSTHAQSPVLYSAFKAHRDNDEDLQSGAPLEATYYDTWLRIDRMKLDHALFTLDNATVDAPSHFIPWLPRVGSNIGDISQAGSSGAIESYSRSVLALAKSKGIREAIWWGDESHVYLGSPDELFEATAIVTDQVMNYNLVGVSTFKYDETVPLAKYSGTALNPFLFSEEHAIDITPAVRNDMQAYPDWFNDPSETGYFTALEASFELTPSDFGTGPTYYYPNAISFVIEALDGGGHWDKGAWSLNDFHELAVMMAPVGIGSAVWISVSDIPGASITELYSTSTRKSEFSADPSKPYSVGAYAYSFDDEGIGGAYTLSNVIDRKSILRIDIPLNFSIGLDDYTSTDFFSSSNRVTLRYALYHETDTLPTEDPLPYRVDLLQLFDSTPTGDTRITRSARRGDVSGDGAVDMHDLRILLEAVGSGATRQAYDINGDGIVDAEDIKAMIVDGLRK